MPETPEKPANPADSRFPANRKSEGGLTECTVLLPDEDAERYTRHTASLFESHKPVGEKECALVQSLADTMWRIYRIPALEAGIYTLGLVECKDLFAEEPDPEVRRQLIEAQIYLTYNRQISSLMDQEARLRRREEKDRKLLKELQEKRSREGVLRPDAASSSAGDLPNGAPMKRNVRRHRLFLVSKKTKS